MGDVAVVKAADHFQNGRTFADIAEELVSESLALACAAHESGDIDEVHRSLHGLLRMHEFGQLIKPVVRHGNGSLVRFDGAEGIVGRLRVLRFGQGVEQGGFAHVGQADDADAQCHVRFSEGKRRERSRRIVDELSEGGGKDAECCAAFFRWVMPSV